MEKESKCDSYGVRVCRRKQSWLAVGLLSVFKIELRECIQSMETSILQ